VFSRAAIALPVSLALLAGAADAAVYKCDVGGKTVFSDRPCATDAQKLDIRYRQPDAAAAAEIQRRTDQYYADLDKRKHASKVAAQKQRVRQLERERDAELAALRDKKALANNNLAGAAWEQSISTEMSAVVEQYRQKIDAAQRELQRIETAQP